MSKLKESQERLQEIKELQEYLKKELELKQKRSKANLEERIDAEEVLKKNEREWENNMLGIERKIHEHDLDWCNARSEMQYAIQHNYTEGQKRTIKENLDTQEDRALELQLIKGLFKKDQEKQLADCKEIIKGLQKEEKMLDATIPDLIADIKYLQEKIEKQEGSQGQPATQLEDVSRQPEVSKGPAKS